MLLTTLLKPVFINREQLARFYACILSLQQLRYYYSYYAPKHGDVFWVTNWDVVFKSGQKFKFSRTPLTRALKGNEKLFELAGVRVNESDAKFRL